METLEQTYAHEKIGKLLRMFSAPSVISLVLNALYNMVDQIFIGNGVGYLGNGATNVIFPLTALGVTMKVFTMLQNAITGLCSGAQPIISYNYGRALRGRVRQILKLLLLFSAALMGAATVWFQLAPRGIARIFGSNDALYNEFSVKCLRIFLMLIFLDSFQMIGSSFLQSIGKPIPATALVLFRQIVVQIPAMLILGKQFGIDGLLYAGALSGLLAGVLSIVFLAHEWSALAERKHGRKAEVSPEPSLPRCGDGGQRMIAQKSGRLMQPAVLFCRRCRRAVQSGRSDCPGAPTRCGRSAA